MLSQFSSRGCDLLHENLLYKEICLVGTGEWHLAFDGPSTHQGGGAGLVLYATNGIDISLAFHLELPISANKMSMKL